MLENVKDFLPAAARKLGADKGILKFRIREVWRQVVGDLLARQSQPTELKGGVLYVKTTGPAWTQELLLRQYQILERFNRELPRNPARELHCFLGRLEPGELCFGEKSPPAINWERIDLDRSVEQRIEKLVAEVRDSGLAESLRRFLRQLEKKRALARRKGLRPCTLCSAMQEAPICSSCARERARERWRRVVQTLGRSPWLSRDHLLDSFPDLSIREYFRARQLLWSIWEKSLRDGLREQREGAPLPDGLRTVAVDLCMLATNMTADQLEERHVLYALGPYRGRAYLDNRAPRNDAPWLVGKNYGSSSS